MNKLKKTIPLSLKLSVVLLLVYVLAIIYKVIFDSMNSYKSTEWTAFAILCGFALLLLFSVISTLVIFIQSKGRECYPQFVFSAVLVIGLLIKPSIDQYISTAQLQLYQIVVFLIGYFGLFWSWNKKSKFIKVK